MSKLILYDWRCTKCNTKFEALAKMVELTCDCPECGSTANRLISTPRLDPGNGLDPSMPSAYDRWERVNKQKIAQDKKFYADHGVDKKHHSYGS